MIWCSRQIFVVGLIITIAGGFKFTITKWETPVPGNPNIKLPFLLAQMGDPLTISCQTDDAEATVTLSRRVSNNNPYVDAKETFKERISKIEQSFYITELDRYDRGYFMCAATNGKDPEIEIELGQLSVSQVKRIIEPDIIPSTPSKIIQIETNGSENVTCKTKGLPKVESSTLTWYRNDSGKLTQVDDSKVVRGGYYKKDTGDHIDVEILMFKNFGRDDLGTYSCRRKLDTSDPSYNYVKIEFQPDVEPAVTFPDIPSDIVYLKPGIGVYSLRCSTGGSPRPKKYWRKDGQLIHNCPNAYIPDCIYSLVITAHPKHSGIYECVAENYLKTVTKSVSIQIFDPPVLSKPTPTKVAGYEVDEELYCIVKTGNPMPFIRWEFQPDTCDTQSAGRCDPIESDWKQFLLQKPDDKTATNFSSIVATKTKSNFFYRCIAENAQGNDSYPFSLVRKENAPAQFFITPKGNHTITEQDALIIQCTSDVYIFKSVRITKDGTELSAIENITDSVRLTTFQVDSVKLSADGEYQCEAVLRRGGNQEVMNTIRVKKLIKPTIIGFIDLEVSQDVLSNMNVTCLATGHPPPDFSFKFNGELLDSRSTINDINRCNTSVSGIYKLRSMTNVLLLCKMDFENQQGTYECEASNKVGTATKQMNVTILAKPKIYNNGKDWQESLSGVSKVTCESKANPPAMVSWYRINKNTNKPELVSSGMKADILYLDKNVEDAASGYNCTASSKLGNVTKYVQILTGGSAAIGPVSKGTIIGVVVAAIIIVLIALILVLLYRRHLKNRYALYLEPNEDWQIDPDRTLFEQSCELPYDMDWEFPRSKITLLKTLGSGAFGQVWLAEAEGIHGFAPRDKSSSAAKRRKSIKGTRRRYHSLSVRYRKQLNVEEVTTLEKTMVAVKTLKDGAAEGEYKDLASELKILIHLGEHKNIVNLLGACTTDGKLYVILECCPHGNLLNFLRGKREIFEPVWTKYKTDMENEFTYIDLLMIVIQVSKGMDFLQSQKCVHRDLAARNILVGQDYIMKIADFGLARDIYKDEFYLKETTGLLPVKWMAPESLFDKVYTSMSDVWSYGIVLWEAFTLGGSPYPGLPTEDLFGFLEDDKRMERPEICPKSVYEIMSDCWTKSPYDRPMFSQIHDRLGNVLKHNVPTDSDYLDFTDAKENDYLAPDAKSNSNEYLEATAENFSPKGQTFVPPPSQTFYDHESDPLPLAPTDGYVPMTQAPPPEPTDGYVPMTPGDHYQSPPSSFRYDGSEDIIV